MNLNIDFLLDYLLKIGISAFCGFLLGFERKSRRHSVGIKTLMLLCVSSTMIGIVSIYMAEIGTIEGDPTRIAAGIITGVGFIGAGVIVKKGLNIHGLTTATIILLACAIGLSCSVGLYFPVLITTVIILLLIKIMGFIENLIFPVQKNATIEVIYKDYFVDKNKIAQILEKNKIYIRDYSIDYSTKTEFTTISLVIRTQKSTDYQNVIQELSNDEKFVSITIV